MTRAVAFLNPNSTESMTREMVEVARRAARGVAAVTGLTNIGGPPAIQGVEDAEASLPGLTRIAARAAREGAGALVVACFDDTGLADLRASAGRPVIGLGEAGCLAASLLASRFAVVTTTAGSVPVIEENISLMGLAPRCHGVFAANVPVLDLPHRLDLVRATLRAVADAAPGVAIVLGCAGMAPLAGRIAEGAPVPVVDPVRAALGLALAALDASGADGSFA